MFRSAASITMIGCLAVAGCGDKDAIDTTADYAIQGGTLEVSNLVLEAPAAIRPSSGTSCGEPGWNCF